MGMFVYDTETKDGGIMTNVKPLAALEVMQRLVFAAQEKANENRVVEGVPPAGEGVPDAVRPAA